MTGKMKGQENTTEKHLHHGKLIMPVSIITVLMLLFMTAYQVLKRIILPDITMWQSNLITVVFVSTVASLIGFIMLKRLQRKDAESESVLQEQINFMQTLIDSIPAPLFYKDEELIYRGCNQAFQEYLGLTREQILGKSMFDISPPEQAEKYHQMDLSLIRDSGKQFYEATVKHADGTIRDVVFSKATFLKSDGSVGGMIGVITDITEQKRLIKQYEDALENVSKLEYIVNRSPAIAFIWRAEEEWPAEYVNESIRQFGYTPEDFYAHRINFADIVHPDDLARVAEEMRQFSEEGKVEFTQEYRIVDRYGETHWVDDHTWVQRDDAGTISHYQGIIIDRTERKRAENALRESEEKYRTLVEDINDIIYSFDEKGIFTYISPAVQQLGYTPDEVIGKPVINFIHQEDVPKAIDFHRKITKGEESRPAEYRARTKSGDIRWLRAFGKVFYEEGVPSFSRGVLTDITERKEAEEMIQNSLREKEVLLKEIHHRVKNNFAVISSLLNIQKKAVPDEASVRILDDMQTRIRTMSLIHEKLYQSDDLSLIDFSGYIKTIAGEIQKMYGHRPGITLRSDLEPVQLSIGQAIPCGLILNEILSNSFNHAFPGEREGSVSIAIHQNKGEISLHIGDNGVGMPEEVDFGRTESLGLQLVHLLAEQQLRGSITLNREGGTSFDIRFPKE